ncbi:MAG TPA: hypothetical protein VH855_20490 [Acetobacteraceae bacterium]|jgi:hypothetical protein
MQPQPLPYDPLVLDAFVDLAGSRVWTARLAEIRVRAAAGPRAGRLLRQRHALELAVERLRGGLSRPPSPAELHAARLAGEAALLSRSLSARGRRRLRENLRAGLQGDRSLVPLFHLLRTAALERSRGFSVTFPGLERDAPYDLLIARGASEAEVACEVVSADQGRLVARDAWMQLADRVSDDVRTWLSACPGSHLLKMTLPEGLQPDALAAMHARIRRLLEARRRQDHDRAGVLRLEPLVLARKQYETGLLNSLRSEFGPEAHLAVTAAEAGVFVMAARAGRIDEVGTAVHRHLLEIARTRLSGGRRPGILAMFIEDVGRADWFGLRDSLSLEGEARRFLAHQAARHVVAVTCTSRFELFGMADAACEGELRFRNPAHPAAKAVSLAPAILSSV